jgi:hypothetical protein
MDRSRPTYSRCPLAGCRQRFPQNGVLRPQLGNGDLGIGGISSGRPGAVAGPQWTRMRYHRRNQASGVYQPFTARGHPMKERWNHLPGAWNAVTGWLRQCTPPTVPLQPRCRCTQLGVFRFAPWLELVSPFHIFSPNRCGRGVSLRRPSGTARLFPSYRCRKY